MRPTKVIAGHGALTGPDGTPAKGAGKTVVRARPWRRLVHVAGLVWDYLIDRNRAPERSLLPKGQRLRMAIASRVGNPKSVIAAYVAVMENRRGFSGTNTRINRLAELWLHADSTYRLAAVPTRRSSPNIGQRDLVSVKIGRTFGRSVSRIRLKAPFAGQRTLIEKVYLATPHSGKALDGNAELRFYLTYPGASSPHFGVPRLLSVSHTPHGIVMLIEDMGAPSTHKFRSYPFALTADSLRPIVRALAGFNYSRFGRKSGMTMGVATASDVYSVVWGERQVPWKGLARTTNLSAELVRTMAARIKRFHHLKDAILADLSRAGLVLSHNDVARGNILIADDGRIVFIDFESARMTPPGFDIGNLIVFALRGDSRAGRLPSKADLVDLHGDLVDSYLQACPQNLRPDRDLVMRASAFAFTARMLATPKAIRVMLKEKGEGAEARTIIVELFAHMLALTLGESRPRPG